MLETFGIACCGPFVYPKELRLIARGILPFGMKTVGRFFNVIGPFLAAIPVTTQITGASDHSVLPTFRQLVSEDAGKRYWIVSNELGVDELLSIVPSTVYDSERGEEFTLDPDELGLGHGSFDDLLPVGDLDNTVPHFLALVGGDGPPAALESIMLNAGALAANGGVVEDLPAGIKLAAETMSNGEPERLIERIRAHATSGAPAR
jgi:anthranilate phosphoribosyltransferase